MEQSFDSLVIGHHAGMTTDSRGMQRFNALLSQILVIPNVYIAFVPYYSSSDSVIFLRVRRNKEFL